LKLSGLSRLTLLFLLPLLLANKGLAQAPPAGGGAYLDSSNEWDFFLGGSYARAFSGSRTGNVAGWDATLSNFPYESHPWIGGTIDVGGYYANQSGTSIQYYSFMGGPVVAVRSSRLQPFARVMLGAVAESAPGSSTPPPSGLPHRVGASGDVSPAASSSTSSDTATSFGFDAGGGIDYPITSRIAARIQADWTPYWVNSQRQDNVRASVGLDFRF
jgi:opacity protein-like surface antigen